jgi:hypothetical protein
MVIGALTAGAGKNKKGPFVPETAAGASPFASDEVHRPRPSSHRQRSFIFALFESLGEAELGPNPYTHTPAIELVDEAEASRR